MVAKQKGCGTGQIGIVRIKKRSKKNGTRNVFRFFLLYLFAIVIHCDDTGGVRFYDLSQSRKIPSLVAVWFASGKDFLCLLLVIGSD